ncbi:MAG: hypothetical protein Q4F43_07950 [Eubacteriales bacterium]|nr:hypothetical protein [Eubacteriales bacterium]
MTETNTSVLSSCREIAILDADHAVTLVQHGKTRRIYVKKALSAHSVGVYRCLRGHYIEGIPEVVEVGRVPETGAAGKPAKVGESIKDREYVKDGESPEDGEHVKDRKSVKDGEYAADGEYALEEYVSGQVLLDILDNGNCFPVEDAVDITEQLCRILQALRGASPPIAGCDLNPSNILLTSDGLVRVRDLRSSRQIDPDYPGRRRERLSSTIGKAAPAATALQDGTLQADIQAVGALFCQLITGHLPEDEAYVGKLPGGKPGHVIRKCADPNPARRYRDLNSLLRDLDACRVHPTIDHSITSGGIYDHSCESSLLPGHPYLLPGFRSGNPLHYLTAIFTYALLILMSFTFTLEDFPPGYQMWAARLVFFLCGSIILLFTGNWLDIWRHLRITRIRNPLLRLLVVLIIDAVLFILSILAIIFTGLALGVYHSSLF